MKKAIILACSLAIGLGAITPFALAAGQRQMYLHQGNEPRVWTDPRTTCQYLILHGYHDYAITPRRGMNNPRCNV